MTSSEDLPSRPVTSRLTTTSRQSIAVIVPCFNEAATIASVVADFQRVLPEATVFVFDNMSTDETAAIAATAGAVVVPATRRGKGSVVRKMFSEVEAEVYLMVDGDGTYEPGAAREMIRMLQDDVLDMVVGARVPADAEGRE